MPLLAFERDSVSNHLVVDHLRSNDLLPSSLGGCLTERSGGPRVKKVLIDALEVRAVESFVQILAPGGDSHALNVISSLLLCHRRLGQERAVVD